MNNYQAWLAVFSSHLTKWVPEVHYPNTDQEREMILDLFNCWYSPEKAANRWAEYIITGK